MIHRSGVRAFTTAKSKIGARFIHEGQTEGQAEHNQSTNRCGQSEFFLNSIAYGSELYAHGLFRQYAGRMSTCRKINRNFGVPSFGVELKFARVTGESCLRLCRVASRESKVRGWCGRLVGSAGPCLHTRSRTHPM